MEEQHSKPRLLEWKTTTNHPLILTTKVERCFETQGLSLLSKGAVKGGFTQTAMWNKISKH